MGRAFKHVILGGGTSAGYACHELAAGGAAAGEVCVLAEEQVAPYERPALSKGYLLPEGAVRLPAFHTCVGTGKERQTTKWYKDRGIELLLGTRVVAADVKRKTLTTAAGETITYQTLIVATGARVLKLEEFGVTGADCGRICYLRDLNDASKLVDTMASCRGGRAVVIGGGYIGMEVAAALVGNSISVTMVFPESHCMARLFTPAIAAFYEDVYKKKGVTFIKGMVMSAFERSSTGEVAAVILKDGTRLVCDMVVVGIGIRANTALFEGQLAIEKGGIKVNGKMRSSNSHVYAIGDVAAFPLPLYGDVRRLEHVDHARRSAAHAVAAILAGHEKVPDYDYLPYFYSRVFTLSWQFFGDNVGQCVMFGDSGRGKFGAYWVDKSKLVGAFLEGGTQDEYAALSHVARAKPLVENLESLSEDGLAFALQLAEKSYQGVQTKGPELQSGGGLHMQQLAPPSLALQASAGVAIAVAIVLTAYWHGRWKKKW